MLRLQKDDEEERKKLEQEFKDRKIKQDLKNIPKVSVTVDKDPGKNSSPKVTKVSQLVSSIKDSSKNLDTKRVEEEKKRINEEKKKMEDHRKKISEEKKKLEEEKKRIEQERQEMEKQRKALIDEALEMEQESRELQANAKKARQQAHQRKNLDLVEEDLILQREEEWKKKRSQKNHPRKDVTFQMAQGLESQGLEDSDEEEDVDEEDIVACVVCGQTDSIGELYSCHGLDCGRVFHLPCAGIPLTEYSETWMCMTCMS